MSRTRTSEYECATHGAFAVENERDDFSGEWWPVGAPLCQAERRVLGDDGELLSVTVCGEEGVWKR